MAHTHNFNFNLNGFTVEGEMSFNGGQEPNFTTDSSESMTVKQHKGVQRLFETLVDLYKLYGSIGKIEVVEK